MQMKMDIFSVVLADLSVFGNMQIVDTWLNVVSQ